MPAQQARERKSAAQSGFDEAKKLIEDRTGMKRLVVHGAKLICSLTDPPKAINVLKVPPGRPRVDDKSLANVSDVQRSTNIDPWPCRCKELDGPCDYQPVGIWQPGVKNQTVDSKLPGMDKAVKVAQRLMDEQGFSANQAAGMLGNILVESDGFRADTEYGRPNAGRGWIQWTGTRRRQFERWSSQQGLSPTSDAANYGYLNAEMKGINGSHWTRGYSLNGLKQQQSVDAATDYFMKGYERPGIPHASRRRERARAVKQQLDTLAVPEIAILNCRHKGLISIVDPNQSIKSAKV